MQFTQQIPVFVLGHQGLGQQRQRLTDIEATIACRTCLTLRAHRIAKIEAHLAKPVMCIRILRIGIDGVLEIDPCGGQVALLHRGLRVREGVGMRRQRHNAEPGAYQKPAELSVAHGI